MGWHAPLAPARGYEPPSVTATIELTVEAVGGGGLTGPEMHLI